MLNLEIVKNCWLANCNVCFCIECFVCSQSAVFTANLSVLKQFLQYFPTSLSTNSQSKLFWDRINDDIVAMYIFITRV